jgi:hypothetical protein
MENINFQPIFDYIDKSQEDLEIRLKRDLASKEDVRKIQETLDSFAKDNKNFGQDLKVVENKASRLESWVLKAAEKTEIPYEA